MKVALYARVLTAGQQQEGTMSRQVRCLKEHIQQQGWSLSPQHEFLDEGCSGASLDRPGLSRLRQSAPGGEFDAVVVLSPDRLTRNYAHQRVLMEEFEKCHVRWVFLESLSAGAPGKQPLHSQAIVAEAGAAGAGPKPATAPAPSVPDQPQRPGGRPCK
jgi:site-specific DNA recombinase